MSRSVRSLLGFALLSTAGAAVAQPQVSGTFSMGAVELAPRHVVAVRTRDTNHPRQDHTVVFLTPAPMNAEALANQRDAYALAINDPALDGQDYVTVFLADDGNAAVNARVGDVQYVESTQAVFGQPGHLKADCASPVAARAECRIWVEQPIEVDDGKPWTLDMRFNVPVIAKLSGKPLPADGGDPGKALVAYMRALGGNDLDAIFKLMSEARIAQHNADYNTPEENLSSLKDIWSARLPKTLKITGGEQIGDERAFVQGEGELYPGLNMMFEVDMTRREGRWVVDDGGSIGMLR